MPEELERKPIGYVRYVYPWGERIKEIYEIPPCSGRKPSPNVFLYGENPNSDKTRRLRQIR